MNRIVVTGGTGRLGEKVIEMLAASGHDVLSIDQASPLKSICKFEKVDLTDAAAVDDLFAGYDAVIHSGAIPGPTSHPQPVTFQNNVMSTWNVAHAAAKQNMKKLVFASSVFTLGWHESAERYWPEYVPVDEEHPLTPFEAYGLSKVVGEEIIASVSREYGIPSISLRIMNVIQEEGFADLPWPAPTKENPIRFVLWPYVHIRDAATACCQALDANVTGHEPMFIAAKQTRFDAETMQLLSEFAPGVELRAELPGRTSVINIEKAMRMIGFAPQF